MSFITNMVDAMTNQKTQENVSNNIQKEDENTGMQEQLKEEVNTENQTSIQEETTQKTYTDEDITEILEQKKEEWYSEWQKEFTDKMPENDRLKTEIIAKNNEIEQLKAEINKGKLQKKVFHTLEELRLPADIEQFVEYSDEENTMKSLDKVVGIVKELVLKGVNMRLASKSPIITMTDVSMSENPSDDFESAFTKNF